MTATILTPQQIAQARKWREWDRTWPWIGKKLGCHWETVRRVLDQDYRDRRRINIREARRARNQRRPSTTGVHSGYHLRPCEFTPAYDPSRDGLPVYDSPAAELLGDPPRGRSALDKRAITMGVP